MGSTTRAERLHRALGLALGDDRFRLRLWDGSAAGPAEPRFSVTVRDRAALRSLVSAAPERAFGRAYARSEIDVEPLEPFLRLTTRLSTPRLLAAWPRVVVAGVAAGARPDHAARSRAEAALRGPRHTRSRDAEAVRHHYDLPPEFYALWLDRTMTYSCAYFEHPDDDLDTAQTAKLDLVCRKLRLRPGERLLDIGSGWGSLALHAAQRYGVRAVGITLSPRQVETARARAARSGLEHRVDFRLADYREPAGGPFDAVASIGMIEHVGRRQLGAYAQAVRHALRPGGRALVHGITCRPHDRINRASFINAFVFPDGELEDVGSVVRALEAAGLEVRDVEGLREHYALTLSHWVRRLEQRWDDAVRIAGEDRARVWRLYISGSAIAFGTGRIGIHQTLAVRATPQGASQLPLTRDDWYASAAVEGAPARREIELTAAPIAVGRVPAR